MSTVKVSNNVIFNMIEENIIEYHKVKSLVDSLDNTKEKSFGIHKNTAYIKAFNLNKNRMLYLEQFFVDLGIAAYLGDKSFTFFPVEDISFGGEIKSINYYEREKNIYEEG